jgi:PAS domain S-box-containing protein
MFPYDQAITTAILETSLDAAFTIQQNGLIVDSNKSATRMFGWSKEEFLGRNISSIVPEPIKSRHDANLLNFNPRIGISHILGNGKLLLAERKDGSNFPVEVGISSFTIDGQRFFTGFVRDMTEKQRHVDHLQYLASHDNDTDLLNYHGLMELAGKIDAEPVEACIYIQIIGFHRIVAVQGREAGRHILRTVADRLRNFLAGEVQPTGDVALARVGESAFALFTSRNDLDIAKGCQATVKAPIPYEQMVLQVVARIGISEQTVDAAESFRNAMSASEQVKQSCGGIFHYCASLSDKLRQELNMESRLRNALKENALRLLLQPKIDFQSEKVIGAEALVRWQDAELGLVSPVDFIPLAERTGQIRGITDWVLQQSLAEIRRYSIEGLSVAVNFSSLDFEQPDLIDRVSKALADSNVDPKQLVIELTESVVADDPTATAQRMRELKALGIAISLDDFGTGYSSLSYLRQFPIDTLKIDASFVRHTPDNPDANAIARAVSALAHALNMKTIAEGVETRAQADFLKSLSVDQCQGFLFSKPLTPEDFHTFVTLRQSSAAKICT